MARFHNIRPASFTAKPFALFDKGWPLLTCGDKGSFNTMTVSWGMAGTLWNLPVVSVFVRPTRYTWQFAEKSELFTLSFLPREYEQLLLFCGTRSGRDVDKIRETGLTPCRGSGGCVYFAEARLVIECRQIYWQDITPRNFLDAGINQNYPKKDYHRNYVGRVIRVLRRRA
ncbi:MAG: flavin reductase family protein [candidate division WOR-3 bacterium]